MLKIVFDNDKVSIFDNNNLVTEGKGIVYKTMANNVIEKNEIFSENWEGHKRIVNLNEKK